MERSEEPPLRLFGVLRVLGAYHVEYILIGGFSLAFHGYSRGTDDVDVVPDPAPENLARLWRALSDLEARPRGLDDFRPEELPPFDLQSLLDRGSWFLSTRLGHLDVIQTLQGVPLGDEPWPLLRPGAVEVELEEVGRPFLVAGRDDLIMLKRAAGRPLDLADIAALRLAEGRDE